MNTPVQTPSFPGDTRIVVSESSIRYSKSDGPFPSFLNNMFKSGRTISPVQQSSRAQRGEGKGGIEREQPSPSCDHGLQLLSWTPSSLDSFWPFFGDMRIKAVSGNQRPLKGPTPSLSLALSPGLGLSQSFVRILMDDLSGAVEAKIPWAREADRSPCWRSYIWSITYRCGNGNKGGGLKRKFWAIWFLDFCYSQLR